MRAHFTARHHQNPPYRRSAALNNSTPAFPESSVKTTSGERRLAPSTVVGKVLVMSEIIFEVREAEEGGFWARALAIAWALTS